MKRWIAVAGVAGSMLVGVALGATVFGPAGAAAQSSGSASTPSASAGPAIPGMPWHHGFGGSFETTSDASVAASAIGITEASLTGQLQAGTTIADVATANGVAVQKVIDALVKDAQDELAAAVKAGRLTQAQALQAKAGIPQRVTAQVHSPGGLCPGHADAGTLA